MPQPASRLTQQPFGQSPDGEAIEIVTLSNLNGIEVRVMTYGGVIVTLKTPDRERRVDDIVLGHDDAAGYFTSAAFFGTLVGRYANRIAKGRFTLDGREYILATNNGPNHLHGGKKGWDKAVWRPEAFNDRRGVGVTLTHTSQDGDEGYPGTVKATVTYTLKDADELQIDYVATTDKPTIINLTQHSYFNLAGTSAASILDHEVIHQRRPLHPGRPGPHPNRRARAGAGHAVRFSSADGDRRAHRSRNTNNSSAAAGTTTTSC